MEIARLGFGAVLLVVFAILAVKLWNGSWLFLVAKPDVAKKGTFYPEGTARTGQRVAWVMVACFAVVATLMAYEMGKMTGVPVFVQVATILGNIALVAFCLCLLWALFADRKAQSYQDRFKGGGTRLILLLLASCAAMTVVSLSFV